MTTYNIIHRSSLDNAEGQLRVVEYNINLMVTLRPHDTMDIKELEKERDFLKKRIEFLRSMA